MIKINIRMKLLFIVCIILVPLTTLQIFRMQNEFDEKIQSELQANEEFAEAIITCFMNFIQETWIKQEDFGVYMRLYPNLNSEEIQRYMEELQKNQDTLSGIAWVKPDGMIAASSIRRTYVDTVAKTEWFQRIINGEEKVVSDLEISALNQLESITIARAVREGEELLGIMAACVDLKQLSRRLPHSIHTRNRANFGTVLFYYLVVF